jgi:hypothetical protein
MNNEIHTFSILLKFIDFLLKNIEHQIVIICINIGNATKPNAGMYIPIDM